jgi:hypothetical protein
LWTELEAGRVEIDFHDGTPHEIRPAGGFAMQATGGSFSQPVHLELRVARDISTIVKVELSRTGGGSLTSLSWNTSLDATGGLYRVATTSRGGAVSARDTTRGGRILEVDGSYVEIRPFHGPGPEVNVLRAAVGISVPFGPYFSGRIGWDFIRQQSPAQGATSSDFDRHRYSASVALGPKR